MVDCVNLLDEAEKKGICINLEKLSKELGVPVVGTVAREKENLDGLLKKLDVCVEMPCRENQEEANT